MPATFQISIAFLIAYLLGSIPSAVWVGRIFYDKDVREYGSGNAGATNTFRVLGKKPGTAVLLIDVFKGMLAASIGYVLLQNGAIGNTWLISIILLLGITAVAGHIFPVFAGFKGGKGIATLLGMAFTVDPVGALITIFVFLLTLSVSKYVSLSSILGCLSWVIYVSFISQGPWQLLVFAIGIFVLICYTHRANIDRLFKGTESKTFLIKKDK